MITFCRLEVEYVPVLYLSSSLDVAQCIRHSSCPVPMKRSSDRDPRLAIFAKLYSWYDILLGYLFDFD